MTPYKTDVIEYSTEWEILDGAMATPTAVVLPFVDPTGNAQGGSEELNGDEGERLWIDFANHAQLGEHRQAQQLAVLLFKAPKMYRFMREVVKLWDASNGAYRLDVEEIAVMRAIVAEIQKAAPKQ